MLYIYLGQIANGSSSEYIRNAGSIFDTLYEESWIGDWERVIIEDINESQVISPHIINSPYLGKVCMQELERKTKTLITMKHLDNVVFSGDALCKYCWRYLAKLSSQKDLVITLSHIPSFHRCSHFKVKILNDGTEYFSTKGLFDALCTRVESLSDIHKFESIDWPIELKDPLP